MPSAEHGRMYGDGLYCSGYGLDGSEKSFNYTSYHGSYWSHGRSDSAFMGLYEAACGTPLVIDGWGKYSKESLRSKGYDCLHAKAGSALRHDEIVFYEESCLCLRYLCEFK